MSGPPAKHNGVLTWGSAQGDVHWMNARSVRSVQVKKSNRRHQQKAQKRKNVMLVDEAVASETPYVKSSLEAAVRCSAPGDKIDVRPGSYMGDSKFNGGLQFKGGITVSGTGAKPSDTVVKITSCLSVTGFDGPMLFQNITFEYSGKRSIAVDLKHGDVELRNCVVRGGSVAVAAGVDCVIAHCTVEHAPVEGIVVRGAGASTGAYDEENDEEPKTRTQCLISENTINDCASVGIALIGMEDVCTVRENNVSKCGDAGIMIECEGEPQVLSNFVHECSKVGVHVKAGANPHFQKNEVHHNMLGLAIQGPGTSGTYEENDIFENTAGCAFVDHSEPVIRLNNIRLNGDYGVSVQSSGQPWLEDNDIVFNRKHGVVLNDDSNACVRRNRIHSNAGIGVDIKALVDPGTEVDENKIFGNVVNDIRKDPDSRLVLGINFTGNNPAAATYAALTVSRTLFVDPLTFEADPSKKGDSRLLTFDSIASCLEKAVSGDRVIIRHGIYRENFSLGDGVVVVGNTDGDGVIIHCTEPVQMMSSYGSPCRIGRLTISYQGQKGIAVEVMSGNPSIMDCNIQGGCIKVNAGSSPLICRNEISNSIMDGIDVCGFDAEIDAPAGGARHSHIDTNMSSTSVMIEENTIFDNAGNGISVSGAHCTVTVRTNDIHNNMQNGLMFLDNSAGIVEDNECYGNGDSGALISREANPILKNNRLHNNKKAGVSAHNDALGSLEANHIFENEVGVASLTGSELEITRNKIHDNRTYGVTVHNGGTAMIVENDICANGRFGVVLSNEGASNIMRNRIHVNRTGGISVAPLCLSVIEHNEIFDNGSTTTGSKRVDIKVPDSDPGVRVLLNFVGMRGANDDDVLKKLWEDTEAKAARQVQRLYRGKAGRMNAVTTALDNALDSVDVVSELAGASNAAIKIQAAFRGQAMRNQLVESHVRAALQLVCAQDHYAALVLQHSWKEYRHRRMEQQCFKDTIQHIKTKKGSSSQLSDIVDTRNKQQQNQTEADAAAASKMENAFSVFDMDGNGVLDKQELKAALCSMGASRISDKDFEDLYAKYDEDDSGSINYAEFSVFFSKQMQSRKVNRAASRNASRQGMHTVSKDEAGAEAAHAPPGGINYLQLFSSSMSGDRLEKAATDNLRNLLIAKRVTFREIDLSVTPEEKPWLEEHSSYGGSILPQLFAGEECLGDFQDIQDMEDEGELDDHISKDL